MPMTDNAKGGLPPWTNPEMHHQIPWRDSDILISVPIKSGTTWTMNIVYQLLSGGDPHFQDIYAEVPWIEILTRPGMPVQELIDRVGGMTRDRPRAMKTPTRHRPSFRSSSLAATPTCGTSRSAATRKRHWSRSNPFSNNTRMSGSTCGRSQSRR